MKIEKTASNAGCSQKKKEERRREKNESKSKGEKDVSDPDRKAVIACSPW